MSNGVVCFIYELLTEANYFVPVNLACVSMTRENSYTYSPGRSPITATAITILLAPPKADSYSILITPICVDLRSPHSLAAGFAMTLSLTCAFFFSFPFFMSSYSVDWERADLGKGNFLPRNFGRQTTEYEWLTGKSPS